MEYRETNIFSENRLQELLLGCLATATPPVAKFHFPQKVLLMDVDEPSRSSRNFIELGRPNSTGSGAGGRPVCAVKPSVSGALEYQCCKLSSVLPVSFPYPNSSFYLMHMDLHGRMRTRYHSAHLQNKTKSKLNSSVYLRWKKNLASHLLDPI